MNNEFTPLMTTTIAASSRDNLDKALINYQARIQALNPDSKVKLEVKPNPDSINFTGYDGAVDFNVFVFLKDE